MKYSRCGEDLRGSVLIGGLGRKGGKGFSGGRKVLEEGRLWLQGEEKEGDDEKGRGG